MDRILHVAFLPVLGTEPRASATELPDKQELMCAYLPLVTTLAW